MSEFVDELSETALYLDKTFNKKSLENLKSVKKR
jgi:hypothetical protein